MRIVLIGDIHLYRLWLSPRHMLSKRVLGQTNLWLNRRNKFNHALLPGLIEQAIALEPELCLLSGDLTTTALRSEFDDAMRVLKPMADRVQTIAVPGNHDRYTLASAKQRRMDTMLDAIVPRVFPYDTPLTRQWCLLALDGAVPRAVNARGRLGEAQLRAARQVIESLDESQGLVVLCHYPVALPSETFEHGSHALAERDELRAMLEQCKARVVYLHGHIHRPWHHEPGDGSGVPFTCIDAGAPCMIGRKFPSGQGFYQIDLPEDPRDTIGVVHHLPKFS